MCESGGMMTTGAGGHGHVGWDPPVAGLVPAESIIRMHP
jgi:hypothetical protein